MHKNYCFLPKGCSFVAGFWSWTAASKLSTTNNISSGNINWWSKANMATKIGHTPLKFAQIL